MQNLDQANLAGGRCVRTAAELGGEIADPDHPHPLAVLLAEQSHGLVFIDGHIDGHVLDSFHLQVAQHFVIDEVFNVLKLLVGYAGEVREVKTQVTGIDQ